jgi:hypothetical protein
MPHIKLAKLSQMMCSRRCEEGGKGKGAWKQKGIARIETSDRVNKGGEGVGWGMEYYLSRNQYHLSRFVFNLSVG